MTPFFSHSSYLRQRFGGKVRRLALDAGFSCPHRSSGRGAGGCLFCDSRGSGTGAFDRGLSILDQAEQAIAKLARSGIERYIAYFQAFTGTFAGVEHLERLYRDVAGLDGVVGLTVSTRPDALPDEVVELLRSFAPGGRARTNLDVWIELGLQSACNATLERINRGHDVACFDRAVHRVSAAGLKIAAHVILGLPGEGRDEIFATAEHLASLPLDGIKIHHLYVTRDAPLASLYDEGHVQTLALDEYVPLVIGFLRRLPPEVVVMRLCGGIDRERLLAPVWPVGSGQVASMIRAAMIESGLEQGDLWLRSD